MKKSLYLSLLKKSIGFYFMPIFVISTLSNAYAQTATQANTPTTKISINNNQSHLVDILKQAQHKLNKGSYVIKFIIADNDGIHSYKLQHTNYKNQQFSKVISLDGIANIIIQQDNLISYLSPNNSYSIKSEYISDYIPPIFTHNLDKISQNYIFIDLGYERINGIKTRVINVISKTGFKYQYKIWLDEEQQFLIQANLLDQNGILLEQFKAIDIQPLDKVDEFVNSIMEADQPPLVESEASDNFKWHANWLPDGFKLVKNHSYTIEDGVIESSIYSDGLFTFTIYVAPKILENSSENYYNNGKTNIYSQTREDKEITVIGQLPLQVEKNIIEEVKLTNQ